MLFQFVSCFFLFGVWWFVLFFVWVVVFFKRGTSAVKEVSEQLLGF